MMITEYDDNRQKTVRGEGGMMSRQKPSEYDCLSMRIIVKKPYVRGEGGGRRRVGMMMTTVIV